mmetsp:Transcript_29614/g.61820  ORF Transcript_29614/g.61820 Transcript_29614/m.61820 type:complete len:151 (-) Transcript_29614:1062-1514(-)|eukprot:CAMPEP_0196149460 /NCGR_PEP_ID=MMETSP0910-20130528/29857_1 /TAXON_ID=49265 /ORGANISM="Thalassiosira rotula, Strain GSO102" /LENGTH=150 /DNA_ID=CAMNT_0041412365 /DNA_START=74 /DNA_END=526 /DNA_ORIENTATION=+
MASNSKDDASSSAIQPAQETVTSAEISLFNNVPWPVRPSPGINYNFVAIMYIAGSSLALLFYTLEKVILAPLLEEQDSDDENSLVGSNESINVGENDDTEEGGDAWEEFAKGMEGMYFIFVPFIPCLLWSLIVRYYWLKETTVSHEKKDN